MVIKIEIKKLTVEQQIFATEKHNLIYSFLNLKHLSVDEYYDIVVFGYLRAIRKYFDNIAIWEYQFSTIAFKEMNSELANHFAKNKIGVDMLNQDEASVIDTRLDTNLLTNEIQRLLTSEDFLIYQAKLNGMSIKEISKYFGFTYYKTNKRLDMIKEKISSLLN